MSHYDTPSLYYCINKMFFEKYRNKKNTVIRLNKTNWQINLIL